MDVDRHRAIVDAITTGESATAFRAVDEDLKWAATNLLTALP